MPVTIFNSSKLDGPVALSVGITTTLTITTDAVLIVACCTNFNSLSTVIANGVNLTPLGSVPRGGGILQVWGLTAAPATICSISAKPVGTAARLVGMVAAGYTGQRTTATPFGTIASAANTVSSALNFNLSVSSTTTDLVVGFFATSAAPTVTMNNGTTHNSCTISDRGRLVMADIVGAASITLSATSSANAFWGAIGVPLIESAVGGAVNAILRLRSMRGSGY